MKENILSISNGRKKEKISIYFLQTVTMVTDLFFCVNHFKTLNKTLSPFVVTKGDKGDKGDSDKHLSYPL